MTAGTTRWQYRVVNIRAFGTADRLAMALSYFGQHGWELAHTFDKASNWMQGMEKGFMIFKRAVGPGEEPEGSWAEVWTVEHVAAAYAQLPR